MRLRRRDGVRAAAIVAVCAGLGGCFWPAPGAGPGRTASNAFESEITTATVAELELLWTATGDGEPMREAVTSVRAVHAYDANGAYAFDTGTGGRLWSVPTRWRASARSGRSSPTASRLCWATASATWA
jgi:hypothetical protein